MKKLLLSLGLATTVLAGNSQVILEEHFESTTIPEGWTKTSLNSIGWQFNTPAILSSAYVPIPAHDGMCAAANDDAANANSSMDYLISPELDLTDVSLAILSFDGFLLGDFGSTGKLEARSSGTTTWTTLLDLNPGEEWQQYEVNLSAYVGQTGVQIAFHHNDNGYWADGMAIDNVVITQPEGLNLAFTGITSSEFPMTNSDYFLTGTVKNTGIVPITSFTLSYPVGDSEYSASFTDLNIMPYEEYTFTMPDAISIQENNLYFGIDVTEVNGGDDDMADDNHRNFAVFPMSFIPNKKVVTEQATGTWCGWCPRGHVMTEMLDETYPNSIEIAVHNSDPMTNSTYDSGIASLVPGYPAGLVNRVHNGIDPLEFEDAYLEEIAKNAIASVSVYAEFNSDTRVITATVTGEFAITRDTVNYRLNAIIVEDNVTGSGNTWNQANYYSGGVAGPMGGYESMSNPVPAANMVYHHVGRAILGGWNGSINTIPADVERNVEYIKTYTYNVPASYDESEITVVGVIIDQNTGEIVNAEETTLVFVTAINELDEYGFAYGIYPNPASESAIIDLTIENSSEVAYDIFDITGKHLISEKIGPVSAGRHQLQLYTSSLNAGMYLVTVTVGTKTLSKKLVVK